jgi:hypothetical protein
MQSVLNVFRLVSFSFIGIAVMGFSGCGGSGQPSAASDDEVKQFLQANPENQNPAPPSEAGTITLE